MSEGDFSGFGQVRKEISTGRRNVVAPESRL